VIVVARPRSDWLFQQVHVRGGFSTRPGYFCRVGEYSRVEELARPHKSLLPVGNSLPYPYPPLFRGDLVNVSSVCRHWHRTFTQHAVLWSKLDLGYFTSTSFVKTWLERAKGSALDITSSYFEHADILPLLAPRAQQLRNLHFDCSHWSEIQRFSEGASGPLPLLHSLKSTSALILWAP
jgi:hypothetical protein